MNQIVGLTEPLRASFPSPTASAIIGGARSYSQRVSKSRQLVRDVISGMKLVMRVDPEGIETRGIEEAVLISKALLACSCIAC